jgi:outer membrane protein assembly factor BamB
MGEPLAPGDNYFGYVAKLDSANGKVAWAVPLEGGPSAEIVPNAVAVTSKGNIVVGGFFTGTFHGVTAPGSSGFVVLLDGTTGQITWISAQLAGIDVNKDSAAINGVAVAPDGDVFAVGTASGQVSLPDGDPLGDPDAANNAVALRLDEEGHVTGRATFAAGIDTSCWTVAVEPVSGDVVAGCAYQGNAPSIGATKLPDAPDSYYGVVTRMNAALMPIWATPIESDGGIDIPLVAFDDQARVVVASDFSANVTIEGTTKQGDTDESDLFAAVLRDQGHLVWLRRFGSAPPQAAFAMAVDAAGQIVLGGNFAGTITADACSISSSGGDDIDRGDAFVMKLSPAGTAIWCKRGGSQHFLDTTLGLAVDPLGNVYVGATVADTLSFGDKSVICQSPGCLYGYALARLAP